MPPCPSRLSAPVCAKANMRFKAPRPHATHRSSYQRRREHRGHRSCQPLPLEHHHGRCRRRSVGRNEELRRQLAATTVRQLYVTNASLLLLRNVTVCNSAPALTLTHSLTHSPLTPPAPLLSSQVQFVPFAEIMNSVGQVDHLFALNVLMEIPEQYQIIRRIKLLK